MRGWALAAACAASLLAASRAVAATTYYVSLTGTDSANCGAASAPCKTIQTTIDKTADGDAVRVRNGTYNECLFVIPGTGVGAITLESESFAQNNVVGGAVLDGTGVCDSASAAPGPVAVVFDKSIFRGFAVKKGGDSAVIGLGAVAITNNAITTSTTPTIGGGLFLLTGYYMTDPDAKMEVQQNSVTSNTAVEAGGGVYLDASAIGVPSHVELDGNTFKTNSAGPDLDVGVSGSIGGAIAVFTFTGNDTDVSEVVITSNTIDGNSAKNAPNGGIAYGGGIFVATLGYGTETITVGKENKGNSVLNNTSEGLGAGISANLQVANGATHTIDVGSNSFSANTASLGGGGVHGFFFTADPSTTKTSTFTIEKNAIIGNTALGELGTTGVVGGGGIFAEMFSNRTPAGKSDFRIERNEIRLNTSTSSGGGASLFVFADDDPNLDGAVFEANATLEFENNLVAKNKALKTGAMTNNAIGGGVSAVAQSFGALALAKVDHDYLTVASNETDAGAGGLEWAASSQQDTLATFGKIEMDLTNSILVSNEGFGAGGTIVPSADVSVDVAYVDAFQNVAGDFEPNLGVVPGANGVISVDPTLDAFFLPPFCSATIDKGDPLADVSLEPQPNGGRVNLGHVAGTENATRTFPDINGDGTVDGIDILRLAVAYAATSADARYDPAADLDRNDIVDGTDLSFLAALYALSCP